MWESESKRERCEEADEDLASKKPKLAASGTLECSKDIEYVSNAMEVIRFRVLPASYNPADGKELGTL